MIGTIAAHELRLYRRTPFAWVAAAALQLVLGWLFLSATEQYTILQTSAAHSPASGLTSFLVVNFIAPASVVMMLATPLLCMNLIAAERQSGRYALFASAPVTAGEVVIAKFLAALCFQLAMLALSALLVTTLLFSVKLDLGHLFSAYLGLSLFVTFATAVTLMFSSLTKIPTLAGFLSFSFLILMWMMAAGAGSGLLSVISPSTRMNSFMQGLLDSGDLLYFICTTVILLLLSCWRLASINHHKGAK